MLSTFSLQEELVRNGALCNLTYMPSAEAFSEVYGQLAMSWFIRVRLTGQVFKGGGKNKGGGGSCIKDEFPFKRDWKAHFSLLCFCFEQVSRGASVRRTLMTAQITIAKMGVYVWTA